MNKIRALIIDDELSARENLNYLLNQFCPIVEVVATTNNVNDGIKLIEEHAPEVVFLDIEMPQKNGFQLLKELVNINFQVIFVTAYDNYAIKAFEVSAVDYLLKPIEVDRLTDAVGRLEANRNKSINRQKMVTLQENQQQLTKIAVPHHNDYIVLGIEDILCIEADRMYSKIYTTTTKTHVTAKKLHYYEELLGDVGFIKRVHRSWLVNLNCVAAYSKGDKKLQVAAFQVPVSKTYKGEIEQFLGF